MGRSADPRWEQPVMDMLAHEDDNIRSEAIRAAGHLELAAAREPLLQILDSGPEIDEDVYATVIWSLSQIGGEGVREALENAQEETEDEDLQEFIERALENLEFTEGFDVVDMFDFEEGNPDDFLLDDGNPSQTGKSDEEDL